LYNSSWPHAARACAGVREPSSAHRRLPAGNKFVKRSNCEFRCASLARDWLTGKWPGEEDSKNPADARRRNWRSARSHRARR